MKAKRTVLAALAVLNAVLFLMLVARAAPLPTAVAQPARGGGGGYICATARAAGRTYEVLHMIDLATKQLHTFYPDRGKLLFTGTPRDLEKDFGK
jgi:hypothetical protein